MTKEVQDNYQLKALNETQKLVDKTRQSQSSKAFLNLDKKSINLTGKSLSRLINGTNKKNKFDLVVLDNENQERYEGEVVTSDDVYSTSDNVLATGTSFRFMIPDGSVVNASQYDYMCNVGLTDKQVFAVSNNEDLNEHQIWKDIARKGQEASREKAKDITYLAIGLLRWQIQEETPKDPAEWVSSPVILAPIVTIGRSKEVHRFMVSCDNIRINGVLVNELKKRSINILEKYKDMVFKNGEEIEKVLLEIQEECQVYDGISIDIASKNVCLLDSSKETMCQYVERHMQEISQSPIVQVLLGDRDYKEIPKKVISTKPIWALPADESQKKVVENVLLGESVNVSAAAGTGKTHNTANIIPNFVVNKKSILVMNEKNVANEVLLKQLEKINLADFALVIDPKITTAKILAQVEKVRNMSRKYVDANKSRDLFCECERVNQDYEEFMKALYNPIEGLGMSFYELTGEALSEDMVLGVEEYLNVEVKNYRKVSRMLEDFQQDMNSVVTQEEFLLYLNSGSSNDEESDEILQEHVDELLANGVDVLAFAKIAKVPSKEICLSCKANVARVIANRYLNENVAAKKGNKALKAMLAKVMSTKANCEALSKAFILQEATKRVEKAITEGNELVTMLERLKSSRISALELIKKYGKDLLKIFPIVITTPVAAVTYITDEMNKFDAILIDEASQMPIISVLPFLIDNRQIIAFGDNQQLDISSFFQSKGDDGYDEEGNYDVTKTDTSVLHLVQGKGLTQLQMNYHFRSVTEQLIKVSNELCYSGCLNVTPDVYTSRENLPNKYGYECHSIVMPFDQDKAIVSQTQDDSTLSAYVLDYMVKTRKQMALDIVNRIVALKNEEPDRSIGVIALNEQFYSLIMDQVEDAIEHGILAADLDDEKQLWIKTIENVQGNEADVIIIGIEHARRNTNGDIYPNISGYFNGGAVSEIKGYNRLNVLFTRAKQKNIIYLGFNYQEIENSERGLQRLFTYLKYAQTGEFVSTRKEHAIEDKTNQEIAKVIQGSMENKETRTKIGSNALVVDVAVLDKTNDKKYEAGFMAPNHAISMNELYTKVNMLERAGWSLHPLSLFYVLEKPNLFKKQIESMMSEQVKYSDVEIENYLTDVPPSNPISIAEIHEAIKDKDEEVIEKEELVEEKEEPKVEVKTVQEDFLEEEDQDDGVITIEDLATFDLEKVCTLGASSRKIKLATPEVIDLLYKVDIEALLVKVARNIDNAAKEHDFERLEVLVEKVRFISKKGNKLAKWVTQVLDNVLENRTK